MIRVGIIGLDSTHAVEFTRLLNASAAPETACVVAACAGPLTDFPLSMSRRDAIERQMRDDLSIPILSSRDELLERVDAVMLLGCDGRGHRAEILAVLPTGKPIFVDKPLSADWREAVEILRAAAAAGSPCFSASALRFRPEPDLARLLARQPPVTIFAEVPHLREPGHPDLSWHGIHGVEAAFSLLGPGCQSVQRRLSVLEDVTHGFWANGSSVAISRTATAAGQEFRTTINSAGGKLTLRGHSYAGLLMAITAFFKSRAAPVSLREMVEVLAFIAAADESRAAGGAVIDLAGLLASVDL